MKKAIVTLILLFPLFFACKKEATNLVQDPQLRVRNETSKTLETVQLRDNDLQWGDLGPGDLSDFLPLESIWYYAHHLVEADIDEEHYSIWLGYCGNDSSLYKYYYKGKYEIVIDRYNQDNHTLMTRLELVE